MNKFTTLAALSAVLCLPAMTVQAALLSDDFETNTSGSYTVRDDSTLTEAATAVGPDGSTTFNYDYIAAGIPLAPNSAAATTGGLRITANDTDNGSGNREEDHYTAFHNTSISAVSYIMQVDMYMEVDTAGSGTTEMASIGIGGDGGAPNSLFNPIFGSGHFLSMTGDGGSSSDYRHFISPANPVPSGDGSYLNSTNTTNSTGDTYVAIFPGGDYEGSPGNRWATVTLDVNPNRLIYSINGTPIIETPTVHNTGFVSLGYADLFDSVGPHSVIYDNLSVTEVPEPSSLALLGLGGLALVRRRR